MFPVLEFTDAEFQILDLISEDAHGLVELRGADGREAREALTHLFDLGYVTVEVETTTGTASSYQRLRPAEARAAILDDKNWNANEAAARYTAYRTDDGWTAYARAYRERHANSD